MKNMKLRPSCVFTPRQVIFSSFNLPSWVHMEVDVFLMLYLLHLDFGSVWKVESGHVLEIYRLGVSLHW